MNKAEALKDASIMASKHREERYIYQYTLNGKTVTQHTSTKAWNDLDSWDNSDLTWIGAALSDGRIVGKETGSTW